VDKHDLLLEKLVEQQIRFEEMMKVQIKRLDVQEETFKKKSEDDIAKDLKLAETLAVVDATMKFIKWFATLSGGFIIVDLLKTILIK
jgi:hypothetical protein